MLRKHWAFTAAILLQLVILAAIPARKVRARATGDFVTLETRPVDPYDLLSGYYVTLSYAVEQPPPDLRPTSRDGTIWLIVERDTPSWNLVDVRTVRPVILPDDRAAIRASWNGWRAHLDGASRLYIPEDRRDEVDRLMREAGGRALVDLMVAGDGTPAVLELRVGGRSFGR